MSYRLTESLLLQTPKNMESEKTAPVAEHVDESPPSFQRVEAEMVSNEDGQIHGFETVLDDLPNGYYRSSFFVGTMFAVGIGLTAAVGGFGLAAPALGLINSEIGPDPNISWVSFVYTLTLSIGLLLVGRMSDLFGYARAPRQTVHHPPLTFSDDDGSSSAVQGLPLSDL